MRVRTGTAILKEEMQGSFQINTIFITVDGFVYVTLACNHHITNIPYRFEDTVSRIASVSLSSLHYFQLLLRISDTSLLYS
jgi:hypothetical protein